MKIIAAVGILLLALLLMVQMYRQQNDELRPTVLIGVLLYTAVDNPTLQGFKAVLAEAGYHEGREVSYVLAGPATGMEQLPKLAADLVARQPDLIFSCATPATLAAQQAVKGTSIPLIFSPVNDPVASGIVGSLVSHGENITGVKLAIGDAHRLQMLKKIVPGLSDVCVLNNPEDKSAKATMLAISEAAPRLGLRLRELPVSSTGQVLEAMLALPVECEAVFLPRDSMVESQISTIQAVAIEKRLPLSAPSSVQTEAGALFSYGHYHVDLGRQGGRLAVQILKGVSALDLPIEESRIFFDINLKTAAQIGITIPDHILRQADRIIR